MEMTFYSGKESTEEKIERWKEDITDLLKEMEQDPDADVEIGMHNDREIHVRNGLSEVCITFLPIEDNATYFCVTSPLVYLPNDNFVAFYRSLLDINDILYETPGKLSTHKDFVQMEFSLNTDYLSDDLVKHAVQSILEIADELIIELMDKFGVQRVDE